MKNYESTEDLLNRIVETTAALVVVLDTQGRVTLFNDACEQLTGIARDHICGKPLWESLVPADEREAAIAAFEDLQAGNFPNQHENHWIGADGEHRLIAWSNSALVNDFGQVELVIATGIDITERRDAEDTRQELIRSEAAREAAEATRDSLRLSEEIFSGIVDLCADAIISVDLEQKIALFNQGAEEIFGYAAVEVLGEPLSMLLPADAQPVHGDHMRRFAESANASQRMGERGEIYGVRKGGEVFPAEASISKQKINGQWLFTAVLRDVTEARRAEKELERANEELARSNDDLEHFAAVASHDLQEPLRKIQAFGERLESRYGDTLPERGRDYLTRMQGAAGRMSNLITDLLAFSRVTTRARPFETVDLAQIIEDVIADLVVRIERTAGTVEVGELPVIDADPLQMRLLFQNLIGNGLKFHRDGVAPRVTVSSELTADHQGWHISVTDNGVGFDEKYLDRIFDVFQRLHGRGVYEGTGMGLAIARKIVERHQGTITATSAPEKGSRFTITLPATQQREDEPQEHL